MNSKNANEISSSLYDVNGRIVRTLNDFASNIQQTISIGNLNAGTYLLQMRADENSATRKILVLK